MRTDLETKFTIIGMGFLMEYIAPCYKTMVGAERLNDQIVATTADPCGLAEKSARLGFPVLLNQNTKALEDMAPDVILFAPPPHVAKEIAQQDIRPYYEKLRRAGRPLPDFYAFTPKPVGAVYGEILGNDIAIANIIPNMFVQIGSERVPEEGRTLITFAEGLSTWTAEKRDRILRFFQPLGPSVILPPCQLTPVLSSFSASRVITDVLFAFEESCHTPVAQLAAACRSAFRAQYHYGQPLPPAQESSPAIRTCQSLSLAWLEGVRRGLLEQGISSELAEDTLFPLYDLRLHKLQVEDIYQVQREMRKNATPGGVFERACMLYTQNVQPMLTQFFVSPPPSMEFFLTSFTNSAQALYRELLSHTNAVDAAISETPLRPEHHAALFGFLSKRCIQRFGQNGRQAVLDCAAQYGRERGQRMAKRCLANGDALTMFNYLAYGEWRALPGEADVRVVEYQPQYKTHSHKCPWCEGWKKHGLLSYGSLYCLAVDHGVVEGFNPACAIEINQLQSQGDPVCEFVWLQAGVRGPEDKQRLDEKKKKLTATCSKDFRYHTGHLYRVFLSGLTQRFGPAGTEICEAALFDYRRYYGASCLFPVLECYDEAE